MDSAKNGNMLDLPKKADYNIVAQSDIPYPLVDYGYHPFFRGMYNAYANHRPFTLSPDMIWLLICQGFSQHVNNNSDALRHLFVDFSGKISLVVQDNRIDLNDPNSPWPEVFPQFVKQIDDNIGQDLGNTMTANFTTTTETSRVASQITLMDAMKSYFEFIAFRISCGIPRVTLEGTQEDWQKVLDKTEALRKYKLDWWVDRLEPVLKKFVAAAAGETDRAFWRSMFKYHDGLPCGRPGVVDGWIVKFFPYDRGGHLNSPDSLSIGADLPNELVKVDLKYIDVDKTGHATTTPLMLWAGFVGLKQDEKTFGLKPEIGWMIRKKGSGNSDQILAFLQKENNRVDSGFNAPLSGIQIRVKTIPKELLQIPHIKMLTVYFTDRIVIPAEMTKPQIDSFNMHGDISQSEIDRICKMFPHTKLTINDVGYVNGIATPPLR